jgi:uncharacterized protein YoxC
VDESEDFGSTTSVLIERAPGLAWLPRAFRQRLTPAALASAITALCIAIAYVINAQHDIHNAQNDVHRLQESVASLEQDREVLHKIDTQLAVMNGKVDTIADEVDRQRQWREHVETVAETPSYARRRR